MTLNPAVIDSLEQVENLPESEMQRPLATTREILQKAGTHYVIDTFDQLPEVIDHINLRLKDGESPWNRQVGSRGPAADIG